MPPKMALQLHELGFVVLYKSIERSGVAAARDAVMDLVDADGRRLSARLSSGHTPVTWRELEGIHVGASVPLLQALVPQRLDHLLEAVIGPAYGLLTASALVMTPASLYATPWHRDFGEDASLRRMRATSSVKVLIALRTDEYLTILPATHRVDGSQAAAKPARSIRLRPGDLVVYDWRAIHRTDKPAGRSRLSLLAVFANEATARLMYDELPFALEPVEPNTCAATSAARRAIEAPREWYCTARSKGEAPDAHQTDRQGP